MGISAPPLCRVAPECIREQSRGVHFEGQLMKSMIARHAAGALAAALALSLSLVSFAEERAPNRRPVEQKIADARTQADHGELAIYYEHEAQAAMDRAASHRRVLKAYELAPYSSSFKARLHSSVAFVRQCKTLIRHTEAAAKSYDALAKLHRKAAKAPDQ